MASAIGSDRALPWTWRVSPAALIVSLPVVIAGVVAAAPLAVSIGAVLVCAGPHNLQEARYFLRRLPARLGRLRAFFAVGCCGTAVLAAGFITLVWATRTGRVAGEASSVALAAWETTLIAWMATLVWLRGRTPPRWRCSWLVPTALVAVAAAWAAPAVFSVALVYLHPLLAILFLDRELLRQRSPWRMAVRRAAWMVPPCIVGLLVVAHALPPLVGDDLVSRQIEAHVGGGVVPLVGLRGLVTVHAFLELLHYAVWIVAIPAAALPASWHLDAAPLARRSPAWRLGLRTVSLVGGLLVIGLWAWFAADYAVARDVYFTVAILHVLAEFPMLLRTA